MAVKNVADCTLVDCCSDADTKSPVGDEKLVKLV
jgi:hypothetical protein